MRDQTFCNDKNAVYLPSNTVVTGRVRLLKVANATEEVDF